MELKIKDMNIQHLGRYVSVEGTVIKEEIQYPFCTKAVFQCKKCGHEIAVKQTSFKLEEPDTCENDTCAKKGPFKPLINKGKFLDTQEIIICDYADDGFKYDTERRRVQLKVILLGDTVGKTELEKKYRFTGKFTTSQLGKKLEYLLHANTVARPLTEKERIRIQAEEKMNELYWAATDAPYPSKVREMIEIIQSLSANQLDSKIPLKMVYEEAALKGIDQNLANENIKKMRDRREVLFLDKDHIKLLY